MVEFPFGKPPLTTLPIVGSTARFPIRRIRCAGRIHATHPTEMGHGPDREECFSFQVNHGNLNLSGEFAYPGRSSDVHHEAELAVMLKSGGAGISAEDAMDHVFGFATALNMVRRDLQAGRKWLGRPWEIARAFENSMPVEPVHPAPSLGCMAEGRISLSVNGGVRQQGKLNRLIWKIPELIGCLSGHFELAAGDIILTGTPAGVSSAAKGDLPVVGVGQPAPLAVRVVQGRHPSPVSGAAGSVGRAQQGQKVSTVMPAWSSRLRTEAAIATAPSVSPWTQIVAGLIGIFRPDFEMMAPRSIIRST